MVVQGRVDAAPIATGMPQLRKAHATVPGGLRIIPLGRHGHRRVPGQGNGRSLYGRPEKNSKRKPFVKGDITVRRVRFLSQRRDPQCHPMRTPMRMAKAIFTTNWGQLQKDYPPLRGLKKSRHCAFEQSDPVSSGRSQVLQGSRHLWRRPHEKRHDAHEIGKVAA